MAACRLPAVVSWRTGRCAPHRAGYHRSAENTGQEKTDQTGPKYDALKNGGLEIDGPNKTILVTLVLYKFSTVDCGFKVR